MKRERSSSNGWKVQDSNPSHITTYLSFASQAAQAVLTHCPLVHDKLLEKNCDVDRKSCVSSTRNGIQTKQTGETEAQRIVKKAFLFMVNEKNFNLSICRTNNCLLPKPPINMTMDMKQKEKPPKHPHSHYLHRWRILQCINDAFLNTQRPVCTFFTGLRLALRWSWAQIRELSLLYCGRNNRIPTVDCDSQCEIHLNSRVDSIFGCEKFLKSWNPGIMWGKMCISFK